MKLFQMQYKIKKGKSPWRRVLGIAVPLLASGIMVWWMLSKTDVATIRAVIDRGVGWGYIAIMMALTWLSESIRGIRWGIQLRAAGIRRLPVSVEVKSIYGAYALNLIVTYLGEAWRCIYAAREGKAKLSTVVGTDLGDRISDLIVILILLVLSLVVARPEIMRFTDHYAIGRSIIELASSPGFWITLSGIVMGLVLVAWRCRNEGWMIKARESAIRIWQGFAVLFHMKGLGLYIVLTFGIWVGYFFKIYCCFFAFPFTRHLVSDPGNALGFLPGLVAFVFGSVSMAVPSSGGLGPWNIAVIFALSLFGISDADATSFTVVVWTFQTLTVILLGLYTILTTGIHRLIPPKATAA